MKNKIALILLLLICTTAVMAADSLPIDTLGSKDLSKPLLFYISGDGGFNSFSSSFTREWNKRGYPVLALNAKSYFWKKRLPGDAANDIHALLLQYMRLWKRSEVVFVGYSFGADVMPFVQTRLPADIGGKIRHTVLLSPSANTDFTIHLFYSSGGEDVPAEINKLAKPVLVVFGTAEEKTPDKQISNPAVSIVKVSGDHHYGNAIESLINTIVARL